MKERENMTMKVPGAKRPIKTTLLADATRVHADWYQPISPPAAPTPPNWERWLYVPSIELGNAIALTLDIDPACLSSGKHLIPEYFKTRLVVAIEHLRPGGVLSDFSGEAREGSIVVTLQAVAQLANFCRWSLPPEFPKPEPVPARADVEPIPDDAHREAADVSTDGLVAWQRALLECWPLIRADYASNPSPRNAARWLKKHGPRDAIPEHQPNIESMAWIAASDGASHSVTLKTIQNVISAWKKTGKLPA
jgi:hypothetical protein